MQTPGDFTFGVMEEEGPPGQKAGGLRPFYWRKTIAVMVGVAMGPTLCGASTPQLFANYKPLYLRFRMSISEHHRPRLYGRVHPGSRLPNWESDTTQSIVVYRRQRMA
jgi:hypothetical protein